MWRWQRSERCMGIVVLMTRKSGSGDGGCACGLIKLIIEIDLPSNWLKYEKRALHICSICCTSHSIRRPTHRSMLCQLFECYSCFLLSKPLSLFPSVCLFTMWNILENIHLFSPAGRLSSFSQPTLYVTIYYNSDDSCSLLSLSSGPVSFSSAGRETEKVYGDSASASCHIDGHRYKQGWDHYVDARGLRSHRLAVTTSCIQWNIAVWYTSEKRKKIEKKRGWNYSVDCGQLKGTRERDSYLFLPIRTVCILLRLCAPSVRLFLSWYLFDRIAPFYSIPFNCFLFSTTFLLLPMCTAHIHVLT